MNVNQEHPKRAAWLFAWADTTREEIGDNRPPLEQASVDRDLAVIRSRLDEDEYGLLSKEGCAMSLQQALDYAVGMED